MKLDVDADGCPFTEVAIPGGVARATLLPADREQKRPSLLRLEVRAADLAPTPAVELPASAAGELLAAALHLRAGLPVLAQEVSPEQAARSRLDRMISMASPHLPADLMLQPAPVGRLVYWTQLGPHRLMKLIFSGALPRRSSQSRPPEVLTRVHLRLEPEPHDQDEHHRLHPFTFFNVSNPKEQFSFYAERFEVEFTGLT